MRAALPLCRTVQQAAVCRQSVQGYCDAAKEFFSSEAFEGNLYHATCQLEAAGDDVRHAAFDRLLARRQDFETLVVGRIGRAIILTDRDQELMRLGELVTTGWYPPDTWRTAIVISASDKPKGDRRFDVQFVYRNPGDSPPPLHWAASLRAAWTALKFSTPLPRTLTNLSKSALTRIHAAVSKSLQEQFVATLTPNWVGEQVRQLSFGGIVWVSLAQQASSRMIVLQALQEAAWPPGSPSVRLFTPSLSEDAVKQAVKAINKRLEEAPFLITRAGRMVGWRRQTREESTRTHPRSHL